MRIAFDAKRAFMNDTGLGNYSRVLMDSLFRYFPQHEYFLATPKLTDMYKPVMTEQVHLITPAGLGKFLKPAWRGGLVKQELKRLNIDLYHGLSHEIPVGIHRTGIRSVVTIHDLIFERYPEQYNPADVRIYRSKFRYACKHADMVIAISGQTKQDLMDYYQVPDEKIRVCYQSCGEQFMQEAGATAKEAVRQRYKLPQQYFLYVGSVIERKNLLGICEAMSSIKDSLDIPLVVIGKGGAYMQEVKRYIEANELANRVIFLSERGRVAGEDFPAIYQMAMALIYPSIFEGFGIPVLEALYSKTPVITSGISCMPETGGDAALYIDPFSPDSIAAAMLKLAGDEALRQSMIAKGIAHAAKFSQQATAAAVMKVYEEVLS